MYLAQGQGRMPPGDKILFVTSFISLIMHCKFQSLVFNTFLEIIFQHFLQGRKLDLFIKRSKVILGSSSEQTW